MTAIFAAVVLGPARLTICHGVNDSVDNSIWALWPAAIIGEYTGIARYLCGSPEEMKMMNMENNPLAGTEVHTHAAAGEDVKTDGAPAEANGAANVDGLGITAWEFATGKGLMETHAKVLANGARNPSRNAGRPYNFITWPQIVAMAAAPQKLPKQKSDWVIASLYRDHDARSHEIQREKGIFGLLTVDLDEGNASIEKVLAGIHAVVPNAECLIYSTSSSRENEKRWRAFVPLRVPLPGRDFSGTMTAFLALLREQSNGSLMPDGVARLPGQPSLLPNRGAHYEFLHCPGALLDLTPTHPIIRRRKQIEEMATMPPGSANRKRKTGGSPASQSDKVDVGEGGERSWFSVDRGGVWKNSTRKDSKTGKLMEDRWRVCSELHVLAYTRDAFGEAWGRLLEIIDAEGRSRTWVMPMSLLAGDGKELRGALFSRGLVLSNEFGARHALNDYIQAEKPDEFVRSVTSVGWAGDLFVLPDEIIGLEEENE